MDVFMTFLLLVGCTVVTNDALRHFLGGCICYEFGVFLNENKIPGSFCGSGSSRAAGGRQEAHLDAKSHEKGGPRLRKRIPLGILLGAGGIIFHCIVGHVCLHFFGG